MNDDKKFRTLVCLSFIPYVGLLIALFGSWMAVYKEMRNRWHIALHFLFFLLFSAVFIVAFVLLVTLVAVQQEFWLKMMLILAFGYVLFLLMSIISIIVAKAMLKKYNQKMIS